VLVVVGGSRGIGAAIATAAAQAGFAVLLSYANDGARGEAMAEAIRNGGGIARAIRADTAKLADIEALLAAADELGPLRAMVYNAGITGGSSTLVDADPGLVARVIEVNLTGAILCSRATVARMSTARGGSGGAIVLLSSRATAYGSAGEHVWYAASKGGIDALAVGLAREAGPMGVRVNVVSPGPIDTGMLGEQKKIRAAGLVPLQRIGTPEEVAAAVMFLVSPEAAFISGANLAVSGGR
jgi:NAD(P)-dependent dehydrogenase (short-subunit alcohol dehydrogenase family)